MALLVSCEAALDTVSGGQRLIRVKKRQVHSCVGIKRCSVPGTPVAAGTNVAPENNTDQSTRPLRLTNGMTIASAKTTDRSPGRLPC